MDVYIMLLIYCVLLNSAGCRNKGPILYTQSNIAFDYVVPAPIESSHAVVRSADAYGFKGIGTDVGHVNATYKECPNPCPRTCQNLGMIQYCSEECEPYGWECNPGYVLIKNDQCVLPIDCPGCMGDYNATLMSCPYPCPRTCNHQEPFEICTRICTMGCECKQGYIKNNDGKCILPIDCPVSSGCRGDFNATLKQCPMPCPSTCDHPEPYMYCDKPCPTEEGCECNPGYVFNSDKKCVLPQDCSECKGDKNAILSDCPTPCPTTCDHPLPYQCPLHCLPRGCECKPGFVLDEPGKCVALNECPAKTCNGDRNATLVKCPSPCPRTCDHPTDYNECDLVCPDKGCECYPGYVRNRDGNCILFKDCPGKRNNERELCTANATFKNCPNPCAVTCEQPDPRACYESCVESGCECNPGFYLNHDGKCLKLMDCPGKLCNGDLNATFKHCPDPCPVTCAHPENFEVCDLNCPDTGCECNPGYYLNHDGRCVKLQDCPGALCDGDVNATFKLCPNPCPATCDQPGNAEPCQRVCADTGCECNPGFYVNHDGKCVELHDCPVSNLCSANETLVFCKAECLNNYCPRYEGLSIATCVPPANCQPGCACKSKYLRSFEDNRCILADDCPPVQCKYPNEVWVANPPSCLYERCTDIGKTYVCKNSLSRRPQCICKPGYYRNENDECIPMKDCALGEPTNLCGFNELAVSCKTVCPPQSCDIFYTSYFCEAHTDCVPGCDCLPNYLRNASGVCIFDQECPGPAINPTCGENEVPTACKIVCPPQTCDSLVTFYMCDGKYDCQSGCDCVKGFLRNKAGVCIQADKCFEEHGCEIPERCRATCSNPNPSNCPPIVPSSDNKDGCKCKLGYVLSHLQGVCVKIKECPELSCEISERCRSTCTNPNPSNCPPTALSPDNKDGCKCKLGYVLSDVNGVCVKIEHCPESSCNNDPNAMITKCPWPNPSTCEFPNANSYGKHCVPVGCQCKPGFILSEENGQCILPRQCRQGNPCGINGTFSDCSFACPNHNCPYDDSLFTIACKPGLPCPSGCLCKPYFRRRLDNLSCVFASDCPPVECRRTNEVFDPCASDCLAEYCENRHTTGCKPDPYNCQPKCVCMKGFYRNSNGLCVPENQCPPVECRRTNEVFDPCASDCLAEYCENRHITGCIADPFDCRPKCVCMKGFYRNSDGLCVPENQCIEECSIRQECRPTCANPNPAGCEFIPPSRGNVDRCNCQVGYILLAPGGICIPIEDCPKNQTCNGDPNARIKRCPMPCPSSCISPNAIPCRKMCDPIGCECKPGFLFSEEGRCILPDDCKGGNPCGMYGMFVKCTTECPIDFCPADDSRATVECSSPLFCYSGCMCQTSYRFKSIEDKTCVISSDCPVVNCTRPNEVWSPCPSEDYPEYCKDIDKRQGACSTKFELNCKPKCVCKNLYFRNSNDICVSTKECRRLNAYPIQSTDNYFETS